jgi:acetoin utilization deacetylase AcuC-like enzyme
MLVILNPKHAGHHTPAEIDNGVPTPPHEVPARFDAILAALNADPAFRFEDAPAAGEDALALHDPAYVAYLREASAELGRARGDGPRAVYPSVFPFGPAPQVRGGKALRGAYCFDTFTPITAGTFAAALGGAAAALRAADVVLSGTEPVVYALTRPPGHHAERGRCGGYSYLNSTALAADRLSKAGRVAVLDVDVHHGNGTQHLFYDRGDVFTASVHGDPEVLFPYFSGFADETGTGAGAGCNRNVPVPLGTTEKRYHPHLERAIDAVATFRPAHLVVAFGADAHEADPIGGLKLPTEYYATMGAAVRQLGLPAVVVQEGGYNREVIGACATAFLGALRR